MNRTLMIALFALSSGCAASAGRPASPEVGIKENDEAAKRHEANAQRHDDLADVLQSNDCPPETACWSSFSDQIIAEREAASRQRKLASEHRAKSQSLRDAEAKSCIGVSEYDRSVSPFSHYKDIVEVAPIVVATEEAGGRKPVGIVVTFRPVNGLTVDRLQRIADCHIARNTALGHDVPELHDCPLVPKVTAKAAAVPKGISISIRGQDAASIDEVLRCWKVIEAPLST